MKHKNHSYNSSISKRPLITTGISHLSENLGEPNVTAKLCYARLFSFGLAAAGFESSSWSLIFSNVDTLFVIMHI